MNDADSKGLRWDAASGIVVVVFFAVAFALPGTPPMADDSVAKISDFLIDKRSEILGANYVLALGAVVFLWFAAVVRAHLRAAGESRISGVVLGAGVALAVMLLCGAAALNAAAFEVADSGDDNLIRALFDLQGFFFALSGVAGGAFNAAVAVSAARSGALPNWLTGFSTVVAVLNLAGGLALLTKSGFFAAGGALSFIAPISALLFILVLSIVLARGAGSPSAAG